MENGDNCNCTTISKLKKNTHFFPDWFLIAMEEQIIANFLFKDPFYLFIKHLIQSDPVLSIKNIARLRCT